MYDIKILPNRSLTISLFCKQALKRSLECEIGTAVEPFREKNNNVKPIRHKNLPGKVLLTDFVFFNIFRLHSSQSNVAMSIDLYSVSNARGSFVHLNSP